MSNPTGSQIATDQTPKKPGKVWGRPFAKGVSGNPGGRKKVPENVGDIAREATPDAMQTLIKIMRSEKASFAVRAYCAEKVMDRAYGKPVQQTNVLVSSNQRPLAQLTDAELMEIIENGRRATALPAPQPAEPPTIEAQVEPDPYRDAIDQIDGIERSDV
jgi:hypothetical protein